MSRPNILTDYTVTESGCWDWSGHIDPNGYGKAYDETAPRDHLDPVTKIEHARRTMQRLGKDVKHAEAAELRRMGLTYREIAAVLGYASKEGAACAVNAAIEKGLVDPDEIPRARFLTELEREDICDLYALGIPQTEIAAWYGVDSSQVSRICAGRTSGHQSSRGAA